MTNNNAMRWWWRLSAWRGGQRWLRAVNRVLTVALFVLLGLFLVNRQHQNRTRSLNARDILLQHNRQTREEDSSDPIAANNPYRDNLLGTQPWSPLELENMRDVGAMDELPWPYSPADVRATLPFLKWLALLREEDVAPMPPPSDGQNEAAAPASTAHSLAEQWAAAAKGEDVVDKDAPVLRTALEHVLLENDNFLSCELSDEDAKAAKGNAVTSQCRRAIHRAACMYQRGFLYPPDIHTTADTEACKDPMSIDNLRVHNQKEREGRSQVDKTNKAGAADGALDVIMPVAPPVRLAVMIVVHGRAVNSIKQLIAALYQPQHIYLIHVDERSAYLYEKLLEETGGIANVHVAPFRLDSIWGAANLYQVYSEGIRYLQQYEWDYFVNLSGADLPLRPIDDLAAFLGQYVGLGYSFLTSHGSNHERFIRKQGFDRTFVQCDHHMHRIGVRRLPPSLRIAGGSDWFILHRSLADFAVGSSQLVREVRRYYDHSLLSAESYFHIIAYNSEFCSRFISSNLRFANWRGSLGCKCQYKHLVDWCGCSPNVFIADDLRLLKSLPSAPNFFARKFDGRVSNSVIHDVFTHVLHAQHVLPRDYYWENVYSVGFPGTDSTSQTFFYSFARASAQFLSRQFEKSGCRVQFTLQRLLDVHSVFHEDSFFGYVITATVSPSSTHATQSTRAVTVQFLLRQISQDQLLPSNVKSVSHPKLQRQLVGASWDPKERNFFRFGGLLSVSDRPKAAQYWAEADAVSSLEVRWTQPGHASASATSTCKLEDDKRVSVADFPPLLGELTPGEWTVQAVATETNEVVATTMMPVVPLHTALSANEQVDALVSKHWSVFGSCVQQGGGFQNDVCADSGRSGRAVIASCSNMVWSPTNPHATFDLRKATQGH